MVKAVGVFYSSDEYNKLKHENENLKCKNKEQQEQLKKQGEIIRDVRVKIERATIAEKLDKIITMLDEKTIQLG